MTQAVFNGMFAKLMAGAVIIGVDEASQTLAGSVYKDPANQAFQVTGASSSGRIVTVPSYVAKISIWQADAANAYAVTIKCGSGTVTIDPGQRVSLITDGSANGISASELTGSVSTSAWQAIAEDADAVAGDHLDLQATDGGFTVTLPADPVLYDEVWFTNEDGSLAVNAVTIDGNGHTIGGFDTCTIGTAGARFSLRFNGTEWGVI